jgi:hypothetical protein
MANPVATQFAFRALDKHIADCLKELHNLDWEDLHCTTYEYGLMHGLLMNFSEMVHYVKGKTDLPTTTETARGTPF